MQLSGLDPKASEPHPFQKRRLGLATTARTVDSSLHSSFDRFADKGSVPILLKDLLQPFQTWDDESALFTE